jgi:hypothetical protein
MKIDITAEQAKTNTQAYAEIVKKLGSADGIKWRYDWCQCIQSTPVQDIFSGKAHADVEKEINKDMDRQFIDAIKAYANSRPSKVRGL